MVEQVLASLSEELNFWEDYEQQASDKASDNRIFMPFGNVNKRNFTLNVPWSAGATNNGANNNINNLNNVQRKPSNQERPSTAAATYF